MGLANVAATFMEHLCECPEHGYSQSERWGDSSRGTCYVECEGIERGFYKGDRDCSSAICDSWQEALRGTPYEGALDGATYTGNMRSVFVESGLFEWQPMSFTAQRGDIYLHEQSHTSMCLDDGSGLYGYDCLGEFCLAETGGIYGQSGDQTGLESYIHEYYDFPWQGILHYNGGADGFYSGGSSTTSSQEQSTQHQQSQPVSTNAIMPRYRVYTKESGWLDWMDGTTDTSGSGDDYAGIEGCWIYDIEFENLGNNGWYKIIRADGSETTNSSGNTNSAIVGVIVYYDTDTSKTNGVYYKAKYQAHWLGPQPDWGKWEYDDEDGGAGNDESSPIDMFRLTLEKA